MELDVYDFKGRGVALTMYNVDEVCLISFWAHTPHLFVDFSSYVDQVC